MSKTASQIVQAICGRFRVFGGNVVPTRYANPISVAMKDNPPVFAAGVDVAEVVGFVLAESAAPASPESPPSAPIQLTPEKLCQVGLLLYGSAWRMPLAAALDVSERTVRRWATGSADIPLGLAEDLADLCGVRAQMFSGLQRELGGVP